MTKAWRLTESHAEFRSVADMVVRAAAEQDCQIRRSGCLVTGAPAKKRSIDGTTLANVRFWHKADMPVVSLDVRFGG